jgi:putative lipoprotein
VVHCQILSVIARRLKSMTRCIGMLMKFLRYILLSASLLVANIGCANLNKSEGRWFSEDKFAHFVGSALLAGAAAKEAQQQGHSDCSAAVIGVSVSLSIGAAKESYDKRIKQTRYSSKDMVWNTGGSLLGSLIGSDC